MTTISTADAEMTKALHAGMPFAERLEIHAIEADAQHIVAAALWEPHLCGAGGVLHGGYLMAMADSSGAALAFLNLAPGETTTTAESKTNFFRPVTAGAVTAASTLIHKGRTTMAVQTDITNEQGALVSRTLQTQTVRPAIG